MTDVIWLDRLNQAVKLDGRKRAAIAREAGIAPETLSRILSGRHKRPSFGTMVRIAAAVKVPIGWLAGEQSLRLIPHDLKVFRELSELLMKVAGTE